MVNVWFLFLIAMAITVTLTPLLIRAALPLGLVDRPAPRKVHSAPVPRIGGVAMLVGSFVPLLLLTDVDRFIGAYAGAAAVLAAFGLWDDRVDLDYRIKFASQLVAVLMVMTLGNVLVAEVMIPERTELPTWLSWALTTVFLVGVTNAINLADGLDGLAGGTTLLCVAALGLFAYLSGDGPALAVSIAVAGSILGFLRYNTHPASVFMGDAGSQLLGFTVAVLAVQITQNPGSSYSTTMPLLLLGVPIIDTLSVMTQRIAEGRSPFSPDRLHIHHKLLAAGLDHYQAVLAIYLLQSVLFLLAWVMRFESDLAILALFAGVTAMVLAALHIMSKRSVQGLAERRDNAASRVARIFRRLREADRLPAWTRSVIALALPIYGTAVVVGAHAVPGDIAVIALGLLVYLGVSSLIGSRLTMGWGQRIALFLAASLLIYLDLQSQHALSWRPVLDWMLFGTVALCVLLNWWLERSRPFAITPLDWIIVFLAVVVPNLPSAGVAPEGLGAAILKGVILFYGIETLAATPAIRSRLLDAGAFIGIGAVVFRAAAAYVTPLS